jgi:beta-lactamase regulating signal transducer with metallopeptidase domain
MYRIALIWFVGAVVFAFHSIFAYYRFGWRLRLYPEVSDPAIQNTLQMICKELHLKKPPRMRFVESILSPAVFGVLNPVVCLPAKPAVTLSLEEMNWVLRHEIAHIKRCDTLVLAGAMLVRAFHWFNPVAWVAVSKLQSCIELAADELATREAEPTKLAEYGQLLLRYASQDYSREHSSMIGLLSMSPSARSLTTSKLRARIERLECSGRRQHWMVRLACLSLLVLVGLSGLTDAMNTTGWNVAHLASPIEEESWLATVREFENVEFSWVPSDANLRNSEPTALAAGNDLVGGSTSKTDASTFGSKQIAISIRKIQTDASLGAGFKWSQSNLVPAEESLTSATVTTVLSEIESLLFIYRCHKPNGCDILQAPRVAMFSGQSAEIGSMSSMQLVTGVRPVATDNTTALQPVTESIDEGFKVQVLATALEHDGVQLDLKILESDIGNIREAVLPIKSEIAPGKFMTIQVPSIHRSTVSTSVKLPKTQSLLIACPASSISKTDQSSSTVTYYLISAEVIPESHIHLETLSQ